MDCKVIDIRTPKKVLLNGLWFGSEKPENVLIFIHGLGSNIFSTGLRLLTPFVDQKTAILLFNNRGHDGITRIRKADRRKHSGVTSFSGGMYHEVFTDCVDDIQGAINCATENHAKRIFLVGHSTGAQKAVYYASKSQKNISGLILLSPLSDYAGVKKSTDPEVLKKAENAARDLVKNNKPHALLSSEVWPYLIDAQRFLSLYTPESREEIFTYASKRNPATLKRVTVPLLVVLGEKDEYRDRPIKHIAQWFEKKLQKKKALVTVIPNADHSFHGMEKDIQKTINQWMKNI